MPCSVGGAWAASYLLFLHPVSDRPCFVEYWAPTFLSWPPTASGLIRWLGFCLAELVNGAGVAASMTHWRNGPAGVALTTVALLLLLAGAVSVGRRDRASSSVGLPRGSYRIPGYVFRTFLKSPFSCSKDGHCLPRGIDLLEQSAEER